ncbi:hypothetical protein DFO58_1596 [Arthrobacter sp. AG1021]|nr:hypothetical protein DFO58_1596 [Arthrobacter sp. AG1021]
MHTAGNTTPFSIGAEANHSDVMTYPTQWDPTSSAFS